VYFTEGVQLRTTGTITTTTTVTVMLTTKTIASTRTRRMRSLPVEAFLRTTAAGVARTRAVLVVRVVVVAARAEGIVLVRNLIARRTVDVRVLVRVLVGWQVTMDVGMAMGVDVRAIRAGGQRPAAGRQPAARDQQREARPPTK